MEWTSEMAEKLKAAGDCRARANVIAAYRELTGKSPATLYRMAAKHGWESGRKPRADKGASGVTDAQLRAVSALLQVTARQNKGAILPVTEAVAITGDSGVIAPGTVSPGRVAAILRARSMGAEALREKTPHVQMASRHANHVHVFDGSVCVQYYLKDGGVAVMDERDFNAKKPKNAQKIRNRLLRMMLVDHFSHVMFVKYYEADGESQTVIFDFLASAWTGGLHEKLPFRGLPKFLLMDAGSANIAKSMLNMIRELGIEIPKNMPHNPRRQGSAECAHNIWETHFEARMRLSPQGAVSMLNSHALDYLVRWNSEKIHRRHGMTRTACWMRHVQGHLVDCPPREMLQEAFALPMETRKVRGDYTITCGNNEYRVKHVAGARPGVEVMIKKRPVLWPQLVVVLDGAEYLAEPVGKLEGGFSAGAVVIGEGYKAQPETPAQKARKENARAAFGEDPEKDAVPFAGSLKVFGHHAEKVAAVPLPPRGAPLLAAHDPGAQMLPVMELFKRLRGAGVVVTPEMNRGLRAELGESVSVSRACGILEALADGREWRGAETRLSAAG
jgi:hypothetical protein